MANVGDRYKVKVGEGVHISAVRHDAYPPRAADPLPRDASLFADYFVLAVVSLASFLSFFFPALLAPVPVIGSWSWQAVTVAGLVLVSVFFGRARSNPTPFQTKPSDYAAVGLGPVTGLSAEARYLDMVKRSVMDVLYQQDEYMAAIRYGSSNVFRSTPGNSLDARVGGETILPASLTMIGLHRLNNIEECIKAAVELGLPGDVMELGSFAGGAMVFGRACLQAFDPTSSRRVVLCDVFSQPPVLAPQGVLAILFHHAVLVVVLRMIAVVARLARPVKRFVMWFALVKLGAFPDEKDTTWSLQEEALVAAISSFVTPRPTRGTTLVAVKENFCRFGLLDDRVKFLPGFWPGTIEASDVTQVSVLRLDGDTYTSTMSGLEAAYHLVVPGGFVIVDDMYSYPTCEAAIVEFRKREGITDAIHRIDGLSCWWQKGSG